MELPERIDSKFRLVLLAATRAEQMMRGASPKVEMQNVKPTRIAMEEIRRDLVYWDHGPVPEAPDSELEENAENP